jgi:hypothetical protein
MNDETITVAADETTTSAAPVETNESAAAVADAPVVKSKRQRKAERKPAADKASKPKRKKGKGKASKPAVAPTVRDAFGNRIGTSSAAINATLLKAGVPLTVKEIHERTGADGRATEGATRGHVMWLLARGHVKLKDGGYVKASKAKRKAKGDKPAADETGEGEGASE